MSVLRQHVICRNISHESSKRLISRQCVFSRASSRQHHNHQLHHISGCSVTIEPVLRTSRQTCFRRRRTPWLRCWPSRMRHQAPPLCITHTAFDPHWTAGKGRQQYALNTSVRMSCDANSDSLTCARSLLCSLQRIELILNYVPLCGDQCALPRTTRMPRPPPPNAAFRMMGNPALAANACASSAVDIAVSVPGTTGTPISWAIARAVVLLPIACAAPGTSVRMSRTCHVPPASGCNSAGLQMGILSHHHPVCLQLSRLTLHSESGTDNYELDTPQMTLGPSPVLLWALDCATQCTSRQREHRFVTRVSAPRWSPAWGQ